MMIDITRADFMTDLLDDEPRIADWRLAEVLGFTHTPEIRRLIERHRSRLEWFGELCHHDTVSRRGGGGEYRLSFNQAIVIIVKSDAPNADPVLRHVVEIYGLWARDELVPRDADAELKVADATARAFDAAPELMQLVKPAVVEAAVEALRTMNIVKSEDLWRLEDNIRYEVEKQLKPLKATVDRAESAVTGLQCDFWEADKRNPAAIERMRDERDRQANGQIVTLKTENGKLKEQVDSLNRQVGALLEHARANPVPGVGTPIGTSGRHILATPQKEQPEN